MSIFHDGILVDVHVHYWSGAKLLTAQDLGLSEEEVSEAFKLGKKELIPAEIMKQFRTLEGKARYVVESNSFSFPVGHANFLPKKRAEKVFRELETYKDAYDQLTDDLIRNYPQYKEQMRPVYLEAAEKAYINQLPTGVSEFSIEGEEVKKQEFINNYIARIESHYPMAESLRNRFALNWDVYTISLDASKTTSSHVLARMSLEEEAHLHRLTEQAMSDAKRQLDIEDYKAQTHERIGGFVDDVVKVLRKQTSDLCQSVVTNIQNGQVITGRTFNRLRDFIDKFQDMNFVGDSEVEEQLNSLKKEFLDVFPTEQVRDDGDLKEELTRRLTLISTKASETVDVSDITGEYTRKILFKRDNNGPTNPDNN